MTVSRAGASRAAGPTSARSRQPFGRWVRSSSAGAPGTGRRCARISIDMVSGSTRPRLAISPGRHRHRAPGHLRQGSGRARLPSLWRLRRRRRPTSTTSRAASSEELAGQCGDGPGSGLRRLLPEGRERPRAGSGDGSRCGRSDPAPPPSRRERERDLPRGAAAQPRPSPSTTSTSSSSPFARARSNRWPTCVSDRRSRSRPTKDWTEEDAYARIKARAADVFCFSPYWVGSLAGFQHLAHVAHLEGLEICKHTHGELGIAATACHHLLLTLPNVVEGNQQTAHLMVHDVIRDPAHCNAAPWGVPDGRVSGSQSTTMRWPRPPLATGSRVSTSPINGS